MAPSSDSRPGTHLPTGWRVVGRHAERIVERAQANALEHLTAGDVADTLYAIQCTWEPVVRGRPTVERILDAITEEVRGTWSECPRLSRDEEVERSPSRFGGLRYQLQADPGEAWLGEVVWRAVHPVVAGAPVTTRVLLEETPTYTRLGVRVTADDGRTSVRGYVGAGQAQPLFLQRLRADLTPSWLGGPLAAHPIRPGDEEDFVVGVLHARTREFPVAVLSPLEEEGFVLEPEDLAWELLGRARLYVLDRHAQTYALSDAVGDRTMSCYRGAARCYLPGWSRYDDPFEHPLLVRDRLADPVMRAAWLGEIGVWMGERTELPPSLDQQRGSPADDEPVEGDPDGPRARTSEAGESTAPAAGSPERSARTEKPTAISALEAGDRSHQGGGGAADGEPRTSEHSRPPYLDPGPLLRQLQDLQALVQQLLRSNARLTDEVERLRTISAVRSSSTNAIERRLGRVEDILERAFPDGARSVADVEGRLDQQEGTPVSEAEDEGALQLEDVVREAAETHSDALVFLDSAYDSAAESPYEDPERVRAILDAMARVSRQRRDGVLGTSLREAFGDLGIDYRGAIARSTPDRLRQQYRFVHPDGELVEAEEHIALGRTYDPRRCLRVYFSSRVPNEPRFVIGHVGRHFEVRSST